MKALTIASLVLLGFAGSASAVDFTGPVAPATWAVANTGTLTGSSPTLGTAAFTTTQLVLTDSNSNSPSGDSPSCSGGFFQTLGPCQLQVTRGLAGTYSFSWAYLTSDGAGPGGDIFGVIVDSLRTQLSDPGGASSQSGTRSFTALSSFGFFMNCTDCIGGSARTTISQFNFTAAPVPEPETYALLFAGMLGLVVRSKTRRRQGNAQIL
ncbi:MAG: PEP-CTERM sorting domain-containing protein [Pseudomonadota bacterium]|nr:PEP-CTERM sorting domain-containing protein [Pseudomonadota bacterium]